MPQIYRKSNKNLVNFIYLRFTIYSLMKRKKKHIMLWNILITNH